MKIISIFNNKGGIGKTTFALNLATYLALEKNKKILFLDNDSQCNSSMILAGGKLDDLLESSGVNTIEDLFLTRINIDKFIVESKFKNINFISSSRKHSKTDWEYPFNRSKSILRKFSKLDDEYDYAIIDNPPTMFKNVFDILRESDCIITPVEPCIFAVNGLFELISVIADMNYKKEEQTKFLCFLTKVDNRKNKKVVELKEDLKESLGDSFIDNSKLSFLAAYQNATCEYETLISKKDNSIASNELRLLCDDILRRV
ncbi:ParA family protein [uncultured Clostridium sp.]|uniref:ParA family protein n=1 Tax=uncultured Clostridium sp. TaxID=59620 RepID=UPI0026383919|nr:ParA family protein [uncultured Clostridium sp.]